MTLTISSPGRLAKVVSFNHLAILRARKVSIAWREVARTSMERLLLALSVTTPIPSPTTQRTLAAHSHLELRERKKQSLAARRVLEATLAAFGAERRRRPSRVSLTAFEIFGTIPRLTVHFERFV
jgi:hypothetical protein